MVSGRYRPQSGRGGSPGAVGAANGRTRPVAGAGRPVRADPGARRAAGDVCRGAALRNRTGGCHLSGGGEVAGAGAAGVGGDAAGGGAGRAVRQAGARRGGGADGADERGGDRHRVGGRSGTDRFQPADLSAVADDAELGAVQCHSGRDSPAGGAA